MKILNTWVKQCPVKAILPYLAARGVAPGSLFLSENLKPFTLVEFDSAVSSLLEEMGLQALHMVLVSVLLHQQRGLVSPTSMLRNSEDGKVTLSNNTSDHQ